MKTGYNFADTTEVFRRTTQSRKRKSLPVNIERLPETKRLRSGSSLRSFRVVLFYGSYPITPASDILHELSRHKTFGVRTFQAEDEIAAVCAAIGASFAGQIGLTGTSGPGVALKQEAIGLAVMTELPLVIVNVQRGGPSTGLPTKTEQADLFQAVWGRNGECPAIVIAPATPADCFHMAIEAVRLAFKYMSPVFYLSDGYLAMARSRGRFRRSTYHRSTLSSQLIRPRSCLTLATKKHSRARMRFPALRGSNTASVASRSSTSPAT